MKIYLAIAILSFSLSALANQKGNGGDAVICRLPDGTISYELLDFHEARIQRKIRPHGLTGLLLQGPETDTYFSELSAKLRGFDPKVFSTFDVDARILLDAFRAARTGNEASDPRVFFTEDELTDVRDSEELVRGKNCESKQIVNQVLKRFPEDPDFIVQAELFRKFSDAQILGLVIHEAVYRALIRSFRIKTSYVVRYLTATIASKSVDHLEFMDYVRAINGLSGEAEVTFRRGPDEFVIDDSTSLPDGKIFIRRTSAPVILVIDRNGKVDFHESLRTGGVPVRLFTVSEGPKMRVFRNALEVTPLVSSDEIILPFGEVELRSLASDSISLRSSQPGINLKLKPFERRDLEITLSKDLEVSCTMSGGKCVEPLSMIND